MVAAGHVASRESAFPYQWGVTLTATGPHSPASPLSQLNRLFVSALLALARAGDGEAACRLAAQAWSAIRHDDEREAERLTAVLHTLARAAAVPPGLKQGD